MFKKTFYAVGMIIALSLITNQFSTGNSIQTAEANEAMTVGWNLQGSNWYYKKADGSLAKGWLHVNGSWYFMNQQGIMQTGWLKNGVNWYYLKSSGAMAVGWQKIDNEWYYLTSSGAMKVGWAEINQKWYYFNNSGKMLTNWLLAGNKWYYLKPNGDMAVGWAKVDNEWYYFAKSGAMQTGWQEINQKWYYFNGGGKMLTGWIYIGHNWYYLNPNGDMAIGWKEIKGQRYYLKASGAMVTGLQEIDKHFYFFNKSGSIYTGWHESKEGTYYFHPADGKAVTGLVVIDGNAYSFSSKGMLDQQATISGWVYDGNDRYYYQNNEKMTGWQKVDGHWYYLNENGLMQTGWIEVNKVSYYLLSNGQMVTGWQTLDGNKYFFNNSGAMQKGWLKQAEKWYYFKQNGVMVTGKQVINDRIYFFNADGVWITGKVVMHQSYNLTLDEMLNKQLSLNPPPQTDLYKTNIAYVATEFVKIDESNPKKGVTTANINVRELDSVKSHSYGIMSRNTVVNIIETIGDWHKISYVKQWKNAKRSDVELYLNPNNFKEDSKEFLQFLLLSQSADTSVDELNAKVLKGKGILEGKAAVFHKASQQHQVNEVYLISHAILETGNGKSKLATGIEVGLNADGKPEMVIEAKGTDPGNRHKLTQIKTVYNMFGIGAYDVAPEKYGSERAYAEQWFTPEAAILGGVKFVSEKYIDKKQDTLYKMRWNPANPGTHQYATDMGWAVKQTSKMNEIYNLLDAYTLYFEVPQYKK